MRIFKFGGASVKDAEGVRNLYKIISLHRDKPLVIVVSAMGKTTNALEIIARLAFDQKDYQNELHQLVKYHQAICNELFEQTPQDISNWLVQVEELLKHPLKNWLQYYDQIIPFGELISTSIVYHYIKEQVNCEWLDARSVVKTNSFFTEANVDWQLTEHFIARDLPELLENGPVITQGFIGSDLTGKTTTLGREGSDFTGAIFAYCLKAESLTVWKDVPGLLNADPKKFEGAELFDELSYQEVTELTFYGAKVIHPKTIRPLAQREIPLYVKSFIEPSGGGTVIVNKEKIATKHCFVFKEDQLLVTLRVKDSSLMDEKKLVKVFQATSHANIKINLMHNSALTFTICMDDNMDKLNKLKDYLVGDFSVYYNEGLHLATIKNYGQDSFSLLPQMGEKILEQQTRNSYQVLYRPN
ncbi:MAG: aspartate kinase [Flammeovirgaceae bacterium]|nr:aspartate kinase [Flammeovirgaceae bacterium]HCX24055.1 aspartate kinase [Cytophagales bacterium]|tara:strand:- start:5174 stop:6415 length:1242 start_codon:yes stop_codon:yes gene_type:complete